MIPESLSLRTVIAAACAASLLAVAPSAASADPYVVDHCRNWDTNAGASAFGMLTGVTSNTCGRGGSLGQQVPGAALAHNTSAVMQLTIPADRPNIEIRRVQTSYSAPATTQGQAFLSLFDATGRQVHNVVSPAAPEYETVLPAGSRELTWVTYCAAPGPSSACNFATSFRSWFTRIGSISTSRRPRR
ncbi:MAG: hypothetical protein Q8O56_00385 [Solirubrobacteraceae bacterium]|nr:hypothetical protein [Solirubrobacteraceae bacterium]